MPSPREHEAEKSLWLPLAAGLVPSIHAVNRQWHAEKDQHGPEGPYARALRQLKDELQLRLVTLAAPFGWLEATLEEKSEDWLEVGLQLRPPLLGHPHAEGHQDAAHIPLTDETRYALNPLLSAANLD